MSDKTPYTHPGISVNDRLIKANGLTQVQAAGLLGVTKSYLSFILKGQRDLSTNMCLRLEIVFGENAEELAVSQAKYNLARAAKEVDELKLVRFEPLAPLPDMLP